MSNRLVATFKNRSRVFRLVLALGALSPWLADAVAQVAEPPAAPQAAQAAGAVKPPPPPPPAMFARGAGKVNPDLPAFQKVGPGMFALGDVVISKPARTVSLPVVVNMNKGILEYLLVRTSGKTHESLFRTGVDATQLQLALLLLGVEGTDRPLSRQGDPAAPKGNPVDITAHYFKDGKMVPVKPEAWIVRKGDGVSSTPSAPLQWVFTGSIVQDGRFMAQATGSIVAIYHDPVALIDNASPGGESDKMWFVNEETVPTVGTAVTLTITIKNP